MNGRASRALRVLSLPLVSALAVAGLGQPGCSDLRVFVAWMTKLDALGVIEGYRWLRNGPYPPLSAVLLAGMAWTARTFSIEPATALRLWLLAALLLSTAIVWAWTRDLWLAAAFELSLVLVSVPLGYFDLCFVPSLLLSLWALQRGRLALAAALFTVTCLIKWQPLIVAPFLLIHALGPSPGRTPAVRWRHAREIALPVVALVGATFALFGRPLFDNLLFVTSDPLLSGNALNLNWIATHLLRWLQPEWFGGLQDGRCDALYTSDPRLLLPPKLLFAAVGLGLCLAHWKRDKTYAHLLRFALLGYLAYFLFNAGVHENHLVLGQVLALLLCAVDRRHRGTALLWALSSNLNLALFYGLSGDEVGGLRVVGGFDLALLVALLNLAAFAVLVLRVRRSAA